MSGENHNWLDRHIAEQAEIHKRVYGGETVVQEVAEAGQTISDDEFEEYRNETLKGYGEQTV